MNLRVLTSHLHRKNGMVLRQILALALAWEKPRSHNRRIRKLSISFLPRSSLAICPSRYKRNEQTALLPYFLGPRWKCVTLLSFGLLLFPKGLGIQKKEKL
ncbi:hypothetical protein NPIL_681681 [Nephila pilipes]|uniref:Uncharacterized protein n=1 Tax=Nephila pilipes TaxID=299642 RepID=A0A8X6PU68_NEPPI|nr:hypothetical protein NPIL_681681 [Nephila pilipes]